MTYVHDDVKTLRSCSLTCHSWHDAAKPLLHYSLTTFTNGIRRWPGPLLEWHNLGLLPLIKRFSILFESPSPGFSHEQFNGEQNLPCFSALRNLQELRIDDLVLSSFMPNIKQHFGHFPTLRSLSLRCPTASCSQMLYFIWLFPNLQDLQLSCFEPAEEDETTSNLAPIPPFRPPLEGRLKLESYRGEEFVVAMIALYGKLPFRCVHLFDVQCTQRILDECVETLEILELRADDYGENPFGLKGRAEINDSQCGSYWSTHVQTSCNTNPFGRLDFLSVRLPAIRTFISSKPRFQPLHPLALSSSPFARDSSSCGGRCDEHRGWFKKLRLAGFVEWRCRALCEQFNEASHSGAQAWGVAFASV